MIARWVLVVGAVLLPAAASAQEPAKPKPKVETTEQLLAALRQPVSLRGQNLATMNLARLIDLLSESHGVRFVVREQEFRTDGLANVTDSVARIHQETVDGLPLRRFLDAVLVEGRMQIGHMGVDATYLIRGVAIEVVHTKYAAKVTQSRIAANGELPPLRLKEPLVSAVYKEKPLNEAVADLAEAFDLTVVVAPQAAEARMAFVTARLLNVPADRALELLALQADLRVVRRGAAYLITSREHAEGMRGEAIEREKQKLDLERARLEVEQLRREVTAPPPKNEPGPAPKP